MMLGMLLRADEQWDALLHVNGTLSEIDDLGFFASGSKDPIVELNYLKANPTCENVCKFPARYSYLNRIGDTNVSFGYCQELQEYRNTMSGTSAKLVFASSFLGSPSSYFGHTFLLISKEDNRFFSNAVGYAAEFSSGESPLAIIKNGLFGGYEGRFIATPYYQLLEQYNVVEQRTLYEYDLDLTAEEIGVMIDHAYELRNVKTPYKFFSSNCAYQMFWFLEVARPHNKLRQKLKPYVIPFETVAVVKDEGMISKVRRQESMVDHLYEVYNTLDSNEKELFSSWKESRNKRNVLEGMGLSDTAKNSYKELINGYYDIMFKKQHTYKSDYNEVKKMTFRPLKKENSDDFEPRNPSKVGVELFHDSHGDGAMYLFRPVLYNKTEERDSLLNESTLEFMNVRVKQQNDTLSIENVDLIQLESFSREFDFYEPLSWRFYAGADRLQNYDDKLRPSIRFALGKDYGNNIINAYAMAQFGGYLTNNISLDVEVIAGVSVWLGKAHINYDFTKSIHSLGKVSYSDNRLTVTYPLNKELSLSLAFQELYHRSSFGFGYRF